MKQVEQNAELLYNSFLQGDNSAFETLVQSYRYSLMLFINRYVQDLHTAEDLAEDVFVRLLVKRPRYKGSEASFKTWLYTAGRNLAVDHLRKHSRVVVVEELPDEQLCSLEEQVLKTERERALYRAIAVLPEEQQRLIYLLYIEGLGYDHAAKVLGKSKSRLYGLARQAKEQIKAVLEKEGFEL